MAVTVARRARPSLVAALLFIALFDPAGQASRAEPTIRFEADPAKSSAGFTLEATGHDVHGTGGRVMGEFRSSVQPAGGAYGLEGEIRIETAGLTTGNATRDRKMREKTLSIEKYPFIRFLPQRAVPAAGASFDSPDGTPLAMTLEGKLTIRESSRPVSIPVKAVVDHGRLTVDGSLRLNFLDYGVPDPSFFVLRVQPEMTVTFHLEAVPR